MARRNGRSHSTGSKICLGVPTCTPPELNPDNHRSAYRNPGDDMLIPCTAEGMEALRGSWDLLTVRVKGPGMD